MRKGIIECWAILILCILIPCLAFAEVPTKGEGGEPFLVDLKSDDPLVRRAAAEALGKMQDPRALVALIHALADEEAGVRRAAIQAVGQIKDPKAIPPLGERLQDEDEFVRVAAIEALEKIGGTEARQLILSALKDFNPLVRAAACNSLGRIGSSEAIPGLAQIAEGDTSTTVRFAAAQALILLRGGMAQGQAPQMPAPKMTAGEQNGSLLAAAAEVAQRIQKRYGLLLDYRKYDIMELLDIEARLKMRHPHDTVEALFGSLLTPEDKERNKGLFPPRQ